MSVPPDMMQRLQTMQRGTTPGGGQPGPAAAPMATPQPKDGRHELAKAHVRIGMDMLEQALASFDAQTKEYKAVLQSLNSLSRAFGKSDTSDLVPAQIKQMYEAMPQMGGGTQQQKMIASMRANAQPAKIPQPPAPMPAPQ